jgi:hypothetical protein
MSEIKSFALRVILWLPVMFGAWYYFSVLWIAPFAAMIDAVMVALLPGLLEAIVQDGNSLTVATSLSVIPAGSSASAAGDIVFELNPLKYAYSVPLYSALVLASAGDDLSRLTRWIVGMVVLATVMLFGSSTDLLKILVFDLGAQTQPTGVLPLWTHDPIALAYQLGYLILPSVVPIMLWFTQFRDYWARFAANPTSQDAGGTGSS